MLQNAQARSATQSFEKSWSQLGNNFDDLQTFCGAIASVMLGTSNVESDFSLINGTKDSGRQSLTNSSLLSTMLFKHYRKLRDFIV